MVRVSHYNFLYFNYMDKLMFDINANDEFGNSQLIPLGFCECEEADRVSEPITENEILGGVDTQKIVGYSCITCEREIDTYPLVNEIRNGQYINE